MQIRRRFVVICLTSAVCKCCKKESRQECTGMKTPFVGHFILLGSRIPALHCTVLNQPEKIHFNINDVFDSRTTNPRFISTVTRPPFDIFL
jgi:hypothetical protein